MMTDELKDSGVVIAVSVVGFVFGLVGLLASFVPCLGALAFYVGVPAIVISGVSLFIAYNQNAKRTFSIIALTISIIGVCVSGLQYYTIKSEANKIQRSFDQPPIQSEENANKDMPYSYKIIDPAKK